MRNRIQKRQVQYLVQLLTHHIECYPDDINRWLQCLKIAYKELVTMDNMGTFEFTDEATAITLDRIFDNLRNDFSRKDIYFPDKEKYYK